MAQRHGIAAARPQRGGAQLAALPPGSDDLEQPPAGGFRDVGGGRVCDDDGQQRGAEVVGQWRRLAAQLLHLRGVGLTVLLLQCCIMVGSDYGEQCGAEEWRRLAAQLLDLRCICHHTCVGLLLHGY